MADPLPSVISGALKRPFAEQVAYFRGKLGDLVPTSKWDDIAKSAHDRSFMVAGAVKADLLSDLAAAVDRSISEGKSLEAFRGDFMTIVERNGWGGFTGDESAARRAWRTRIIYTTNATTSYNAGRHAQLEEAGFPLLVYRHNDTSRNPRPQHLAWNGLTLPADDPFWATHQPQNGWGCKCYVVGARSDSGARRLGGNPDKALPDDWDAIDPKTGEQVGIDKGWGYAPGASVSKEVRQMAEKTLQWDYQLAKAYMQGVPDSRRDALSRAYRSLPSVADDVRRYAQRALNATGKVEVQPYRTMGLLTADDAARVAELTGKNVALFDYAVDQYAPRHIFGEHADEKTEAMRGQRAVTADDYARMPLILNGPDRIWADGEEIVFEKNFGPERQLLVFSPLAKRKMLNLKSMRIISKKSPRSTS